MKGSAKVFSLGRPKKIIIAVITVSLIAAVFYVRAQNSNYIDCSHGLGLSRGEWEELYGTVRKEDSAQSLYGDDQKFFIVSFRDNNVSYISFEFRAGDAMSLVSARDESRKYTPGDAVFVRTEDAGVGP
jgi:hypothetical protein